MDHNISAIFEKKRKIIIKQKNNPGVLNRYFGMFSQPEKKDSRIWKTIRNSYETFLIYSIRLSGLNTGLKAYQVTFTWKENVIVN